MSIMENPSVTNVTITLTEKQLRLVNQALESYFRTRMGQFLDYADDVCMQGVNFSAENPTHDVDFDNFITRRNALKAIMESVFRELTIQTYQKSQDCIDMIDMWEAIRHWLWQQESAERRAEWTVDSRPPLCEGQYPLPVIKKAGE